MSTYPKQEKHLPSKDKAIRRKAIRYQNAQYPKKIPMAHAIRHVLKKDEGGPDGK